MSECQKLHLKSLCGQLSLNKSIHKHIYGLIYTRFSVLLSAIMIIQKSFCEVQHWDKQQSIRVDLDLALYLDPGIFITDACYQHLIA